MNAWHLSGREELLLTAALNPNAVVATKSWEQWASEMALENAPYAELRLLTAVYAHLCQIAPSLKLPNKLRGKARATFTENNLLLYGCLPTLEALHQSCPIILAKGISQCIRLGAWSSRTMGDIDFYVQNHELEHACKILARRGWTPSYGMTWQSLVHRIPTRRQSWNLTNGRSNLDIHWWPEGSPDERSLCRAMWDSATRTDFLGRSLLLQSPEFALITSLDHGFSYGTRADILQTVVDAASLLPICNSEVLRSLLRKAGLVVSFQDLHLKLRKAGFPQGILESHVNDLYDAAPPRRSLTIAKKANLAISTAGNEIETHLLRRPLLYRLWELLGRNARFERLLLRWSGPFSKPLAPLGAFKDDYNLHDCSVIDQIAGPGWSWPEPHQPCFWTDRADARLLVPLAKVAGHAVILGVLQAHFVSANAAVDVFANGTYVATLHLREHLTDAEYCFLVPKQALFGPWIEFSLRPKSYAGDRPMRSHALRQSVPARRLRVIDASQISKVFDERNLHEMYVNLSKEPHALKMERVKRKIEISGFQNHMDIPPDFDPLLYILCHPDLYEHEVDPYVHFVEFGKREGRLWR